MRLLLPLFLLSVAAFPVTLPDAFSSKAAWDYNVKIVGYGERWPGSQGHLKTEVLIRSVLSEDGARIDLRDFTALTPRGPVQVHNIIGRFNDSGDPKQPIFILAGHYDTLYQPGFLGANDAGSSTAILLAFADALAHRKTNMQIWLMWTDLEEAVQSFTANDGLYGSRFLANQLKQNGTAARIKGFFLLDMIADKDLSVARETQSDEGLQATIATAAAQLGYQKYFFNYEEGITDDHVPFIEAGIPSVDIVDAHYGRMGRNFDSMGEFHHSNLDTLERISQSSLEIVGRTVLLTIELLDAGHSSMPPSKPNPPRPR